MNTLPKSYSVQKVMDLSYRALQLQDKNGILSNVNARLAIACATNRKQILQDAVFGQGKDRRTGSARTVRDQPRVGHLPDPELDSREELLEEGRQAQGLLASRPSPRRTSTPRAPTRRSRCRAN